MKVYGFESRSIVFDTYTVKYVCKMLKLTI